MTGVLVFVRGDFWTIKWSQAISQYTNSVVINKRSNLRLNWELISIYQMILGTVIALQVTIASLSQGTTCWCPKNLDLISSFEDEPGRFHIRNSSMIMVSSLRCLRLIGLPYDVLFLIREALFIPFRTIIAILHDGNKSGQHSWLMANPGNSFMQKQII